MGRPRKIIKQRDKEVTKGKLLFAVGEIIRSKGYIGLGLNKVAKQAGVTKKLIYDYFTNLNGLVEEYIKTKDYWMDLSDRIKDIIKELPSGSEADLIGAILEEETNYFYSEKEMQQLIHWQISESTPFLRSISNARESMAGDIFRMTDDTFRNTGVNLRAICALLLGGNYYTILHASTNGSTVCEIDMNIDADRKEVIRTMKQIIKWAYDDAAAQKLAAKKR